jgi:Bacterial regulatory protein, Fis family
MAQSPLQVQILRRAVAAVRAAGGHRQRAADALGIPLPTLQSRLTAAVRRKICTAADIPTLVDRRAQDELRRPGVSIEAHLSGQDARTRAKADEKRYAEALQTIRRLRKEAAAAALLRTTATSVPITPTHGTGHSEGTVVAVASDWHIEERVGPEVGDLNRYTPEIAKARAERFFTSVARLVEILQQDITIDHCILALLGDFITNDIHDELPDVTALLPTHAIVTAQNLLISGIEYLLAHTALRFTLPCHSGNHARTTETTRFASENGHSLEFLLYQHLAAYFRQEPRLTFLIPEGPHSYVQVYGQTIRFQHGHMVKYQGGVGGIYIPVNKAIAQWNKGRHADLDVFGHFHQLRDGGNFVCNGSMIGYNSFALSIKADYEPPKQALFLMDRDRGRTCTWPVWFGDKRKG